MCAFAFRFGVTIADPVSTIGFFFFRGGRAAALPLMVGLLTVVCSFLVIRLIDGVYGLSVYSLNVIFGLGLGLAIDYALFLVSRFREELGAGRDVHGAVRVAMATAGRTVVFSALTIKGVYGREMYETWYKMTAMIQSGLDISPVITHRFPYTQFKEAIELMKSGNSGKIVLNWSEH